jgi:hypothetical protein
MTNVGGLLAAGGILSDVRSAGNATAKKPEWSLLSPGDFQVHTVWSDGSGTI